MRSYNVAVALLSALIGATILWLSRSLTGFDETGVPGEAFWPEAIAWLFIGLGALQLLEVAMLPAVNADKVVDLTSRPVRNAYVGAVIAVAYVVALTWLGFVIATAGFVPVLMVVMGERRPLVLGAVTVGVIAVIWVFFVQVFNTTLPPSIFFA